MRNIGKKWLSSDNVFRQIIGAIINKWCGFVALMLIALIIVLACCNIKSQIAVKLLELSTMTAFAALIAGVCNSLTGIFSLQKKEEGITWCQIIILLVICLWIIGLIWIIDIQKYSDNTVLLGIIGGAMTLVFQDKIKGVITFIHLRQNHLLKIDDWIQVPKYGVDGIVTKVTLTSVTLYNWDTTTSTIPISALSSEHFLNLQNMAEGKTYGWRMFKALIFDTKCFEVMDKNSIELLEKTHHINFYLSEDEKSKGVLNAHLYRVYLYHWLMDNPNISHKPRLMVRWTEHKNGGMQLEVYTFIVTNSMDDYEWKQSLVFEHIAESIKWFGLRLYQLPSGYDVGGGKEVEE